MRARLRGFTLIELLVAMFITAILFSIGYRALSQAFNGRQEIDEQSARLAAVQTAIRVIEQDFELLQPRPVRQVLGDGYQAALVTGQSGVTTFSTTTSGGSSSGGTSNFGSNGRGIGAGNLTLGSSQGASALPIVSFTRGGWTNPAGLQRSELQRVSYVLENGVLLREYYPVLDATATVALVKRPLVDRVKNISFRFMDASHQNWKAQWPEQTQGQTDQTTTLRWRPVAVEVTIELEDWGVIQRVIEVPG